MHASTTVPAEDTSEFDEPLARRAIEGANLNALRMATYQVTGDPSLASMRLVQKALRGGAYFGTALAEEHVAAVRDAALACVRANFGRALPPPPSTEEAFRLMDLFVGEAWSDSLHRIGIEHLAFEPFSRGAAWSTRPSAERLARFRVVIIGAGVDGIMAAIQLQHLGIPFTMIERQAGVGGVWQLNNYPGARVDTPSFAYQYTFERHHWSEHFAARDETLSYLEGVVDKYSVRPHLRLSTEVTAAHWDDPSRSWQLTLVNTQGTEETLSANVVISASGLFSTPNSSPDIPGIETFEGKVFHTTAWDHSYDWGGKRVALLGNGSTGVQVMPVLAETASTLVCFQRTPQWIGPMENYGEPISAELDWLLDHFPYYVNWLRFANIAGILHSHELHPVDPEWQRAGGLINERNDAFRADLTNYLRSKVGDDPELYAKCLPSYAPMVRRLVVDNGWYDALRRDNVELVTAAIERFTPEGIVTVDGTVREFDLVVLAVGFKVSKFLWPVQYVGREGVTLESSWSKDGPRAYLGVTMPGFPNFFMLSGPNHQGRGAGGHYAYSECSSRYIAKAIVALIEGQRTSMEVRSEVFESYNERMDRELEGLIWGLEGHSYYVNEYGRVDTNMPWKPEEFHEWILEPKLEDFILR